MNMTSLSEYGNSSNITSSTLANENDNIEVILYIIFESCIAFFAFINNLFVVIALWKFKSLRTPTNLFVGSLAMADIAVALLAIPSAIILRLGLKINVHCEENEVSDVTTESITSQNGEVSQGICLIMMSSVIILTQVSIFGLFAIAIDRYIGIHYPLRYKMIMTTRKVRICIIAVWFLSAGTEMVAELGWQKWSPPCVEECAFEKIISMEYMVYFNFLGCVLLPLLIMGVLYILIFRSAKQQLRKIYCDVKKMKRNKALFSRSVNFDRSTYTQPRRDKCRITLSLPTDSVGYVVTNEMPATGPRPTSELIAESSGSIDSNFSSTSNRPTTDMTESGWEETQEVLSLDVMTPLPSERMPHYFSKRKNSSEADISALAARFDEIKKAKSLERNLPDVCKPLRPCGKAHSFSASTSTPSPNVNRTSKLQKLRASALRKLTNSSSVTSSRSTIFENEQYALRMKRKSELLNKEFKAARSLASVVGIFAICWLPLHILNTLTLFYSELHQPTWLKDIAILLSHANSIVNPLIYAFKLQEFKIAFRKILKHIVSSPKDCFYSERTGKKPSSRKIGSSECEMTTISIVKKSTHGSSSNRVCASKNNKLSSSERQHDGKTFDSRTDPSANNQSLIIASNNQNLNNNNERRNMSPNNSRRQIFPNYFLHKQKKNIKYSRVDSNHSVLWNGSYTPSTDDFSKSERFDSSLSSSSESDFEIISSERLYNVLLNAEETSI